MASDRSPSVGHTDHEDPETLEDADEAGPDPVHGAGHHAAEAVGPEDHSHGSHATSAHDDHDDHVAENPSWVLLPLAVGLLLGVVLLLILGFDSAAGA